MYVNGFSGNNTIVNKINTCMYGRKESDMVLQEKERTVIQDLQTQEQCCIEKYGKYAQQAKDPELKALFLELQGK